MPNISWRFKTEDLCGRLSFLSCTWAWPTAPGKVFSLKSSVTVWHVSWWQKLIYVCSNMTYYFWNTSTNVIMIQSCKTNVLAVGACVRGFFVLGGFCPGTGRKKSFLNWIRNSRDVNHIWFGSQQQSRGFTIIPNVVRLLNVTHTWLCTYHPNITNGQNDKEITQC